MPNIKSVYNVLPSNKISNSFFYDYIDKKHLKNIENIVGVKERFWADKETSLSMCCEASNLLFHDLGKKNINLKDKIDLLIFVTQTPDKMLPAVAYEAHRILKLQEDCCCYSINAGCTGFVEGIGLAYDLMSVRGYENCLLLVGDTISKYLNNDDPGTFPIFGDAGSAIWIENTKPVKYLYNGGTKINSTRSIELDFSKNNKKKFLTMKGLEVFNFTIRGIPVFVKDTEAKWKVKYRKNLDIDYYFFHQANNMILRNIAKKIKLKRKSDTFEYS